MKKLTILLSIILFICSCNDDSLNLFPLDSISSPTYWNTENDLKTYNNNFYDYAQSGSMRLLVGNAGGSNYYGPYAMDGMTDNDARSSINYNYEQIKIRAGQMTPEENPAPWGWNETTFKFLRSINIGLANYDRADIDPSIIDKYKGEARFFRAWVEADKVSLYGDFPWVDEELNTESPELSAERTPRETVMDNVLDDLDFACKNLPNDWNDGSPGRINRWCALLIKSRICLFEGTWREYHGGNNYEKWLQEAASAAKELIVDGPYQLYSTGDPTHDYNAIFRMSDLSGVDGIMYWRRYKVGVIENDFMIYYYLTSPTKSLVEDYLCIDGLPITLSPLYKSDEIYENIWQNRDSRLRQTVLSPDDLQYYDPYGFAEKGYSPPYLDGLSRLGNKTNATGYVAIKNLINEQSDLGHEGYYPAIIMRFGEALLNYAEAKAELGTITQNDLDISINKLRDRVGMPHMELSNIPVDPRYTDVGVSPLIIEIRRERRIELAFEGFRYDDIRRWGRGELLRQKDYGIRWDEKNRTRFNPNGMVQVQSEIVPGTGVEYLSPLKGSDFENPVFTEKDYLWPIPASARSLNPKLGQNPGW